MVKRTRYVALLAAFALSACSGASPGSLGAAKSLPALLPAAPVADTIDPAHRRQLKASARIYIPRAVKRRRKHGRHPHWVSGATKGVLVVTYLSSDTSHAHAIGSDATDLSSTSGNCTPATGGGRVCNVFAVARVGKNDFVFTTYNEAPVNNVFSPSALELGEATLTKQPIKPKTNPSIPVYISGLIATVGSNHPYVSTSVGSPQTVALSIDAEDFGNQVIGGGAMSPYANPMTATLTESGGSGHAQLLLNGAAAGSSAVLTSSADSVSIAYDGTGSAGYTMRVTVAASGASSQNVRVSPLFVTSTQYYTTSPNALGFTAPAQTATVNVTEANAAGITYTYTATPVSTCGGIATFSPLTGSGAAATIPVAAVGTGLGCTLTVTDSTNTATSIAVQTTTTLGSVHVPASVVSVSTGAATFGATLGPDGNMYDTVPLSQQIYQVNPSCGNCVSTLVNATAGTPMGITMGPDGYMWFTEQGSADEIGRVNTSGSLTEFPITAGAGATGIVEGPDGSMWFTETSINSVGRMTASGAFTTYSSGAGPAGIASGSDGRVWVAAESGQEIDAFDSSGSESSYAISVMPYGIASGPDGNIWFTSMTGNVVGCMTTAGAGCTLAPCPIVSNAAICSGLPAGANPAYITPGAGGALWFAETGAGLGGVGMIGKVTTAGVLSSYTLAPAFDSGSLPTTPVVAADGSIWFSAYGTDNSVGQIVP